MQVALKARGGSSSKLAYSLKEKQPSECGGCRFEPGYANRVYSYPIKTWCFATEGELTMKATEAVEGWRSGRRARVGCFKFKSILSFPCGRRVSDMRVL